MLWMLQQRCQRPCGSSACDAYMFHYPDSIFVVCNAINQNVDDFFLSFSLFFFNLVTSTKISSADVAEFVWADIEMVSRR